MRDIAPPTLGAGHFSPGPLQFYFPHMSAFSAAHVHHRPVRVTTSLMSLRGLGQNVGAPLLELLAIEHPCG